MFACLLRLIPMDVCLQTHGYIGTLVTCGEYATAMIFV